MTDLAAWLLEQIAEERQAIEKEQFSPEEATFVYLTPDMWPSDEYLVICLSVRRALAECEAKRQVVEWSKAWEHEDVGLDPWGPIRRLALAYADHPGYLEEWRP